MQKDISLNSITIRQLTKIYRSLPEAEGYRGKKRFTALKEINCKVEEGEFVCIVGPSGCGKTTLLKLIAGLENPTSGTLDRRGSVAMVFQNGALLPWLNVEDNVGFGLKMKGCDRKLIRKEVKQYLQMVGLSSLVRQMPRDLSGGQRQRVGIARALIVQPKTLLLDEPFSALDTITTDELHADLLAIWSVLKPTVVMVSHSIEEAVLLADRILVMKDGEIKQTVEIVFSRPRLTHQTGYVIAVDKIKKLLSK